MSSGQYEQEEPNSNRSSPLSSSRRDGYVGVGGLTIDTNSSATATPPPALGGYYSLPAAGGASGTTHHNNNNNSNNSTNTTSSANNNNPLSNSGSMRRPPLSPYRSVSGGGGGGGGRGTSPAGLARSPPPPQPQHQPPLVSSSGSGSPHRGVGTSTRHHTNGGNGGAGSSSGIPMQSALEQPSSSLYRSPHLPYPPRAGEGEEEGPHAALRSVHYVRSPQQRNYGHHRDMYHGQSPQNGLGIGIGIGGSASYYSTTTPKRAAAAAAGGLYVDAAGLGLGLVVGGSDAATGGGGSAVRRERRAIDDTRNASLRLGLEPRRMLDTEEDTSGARDHVDHPHKLHPIVKYVPIQRSHETTVIVREQQQPPPAAAAHLSTAATNTLPLDEQHGRTTPLGRKGATASAGVGTSPLQQRSTAVGGDDDGYEGRVSGRGIDAVVGTSSPLRSPCARPHSGPASAGGSPYPPPLGPHHGSGGHSPYGFRVLDHPEIPSGVLDRARRLRGQQQSPPRRRSASSGGSGQRANHRRVSCATLSDASEGDEDGNDGPPSSSGPPPAGVNRSPLNHLGVGLVGEERGRHSQTDNTDGDAMAPASNAVVDGSVLAARLAEQCRLNELRKAELAAVAYRTLVGKAAKFVGVPDPSIAASVQGEREGEGNSAAGPSRAEGSGDGATADGTPNLDAIRSILTAWQEAYAASTLHHAPPTPIPIPPPAAAASESAVDNARRLMAALEGRYNIAMTAVLGQGTAHPEMVNGNNTAHQHHSSTASTYRRGVSAGIDSNFTTASTTALVAALAGGDATAAAICPLVATHALGAIPALGLEASRVQALMALLYDKQSRRAQRMPWRDAEREEAEEHQRMASLQYRGGEGGTDDDSSDDDDNNMGTPLSPNPYADVGSSSSLPSLPHAWHLVSAPNDDEDPFYYYRCDMLNLASHAQQRHVNAVVGGDGSGEYDEHYAASDCDGDFDVHEELDAVIAGAAEYVDCSLRFTHTSAAAVAPFAGAVLLSTLRATASSSSALLPPSSEPFSEPSAAELNPPLRIIVVMGFPTDCPLPLLLEALEGDYGIPCAALYRGAGWGDRSGYAGDDDLPRFDNPLAGAVYVWVPTTFAPSSPAGALLLKANRTTSSRVMMNGCGNLAGALQLGYLKLRVPAWLGPAASRPSSSISGRAEPSASTFVDCAVMECTVQNAVALGEAVPIYVEGRAYAAGGNAPAWAPSSFSSFGGGASPPPCSFIDVLAEAKERVATRFLSSDANGNTSLHGGGFSSVPMRCEGSATSASSPSTTAATSPIVNFMCLVKDHMGFVVGNGLVQRHEARRAATAALAAASSSPFTTSTTTALSASHTHLAMLKSLRRLVQSDAKLLASAANSLSALMTAYFAIAANCGEGEGVEVGDEDDAGGEEPKTEAPHASGTPVADGNALSAVGEVVITVANGALLLLADNNDADNANDSADGSGAALAPLTTATTSPTRSSSAFKSALSTHAASRVPSGVPHAPQAVMNDSTVEEEEEKEKGGDQHDDDATRGEMDVDAVLPTVHGAEGDGAPLPIPTADEASDEYIVDSGAESDAAALSPQSTLQQNDLSSEAPSFTHQQTGGTGQPQEQSVPSQPPSIEADTEEARRRVVMRQLRAIFTKAARRVGANGCGGGDDAPNTGGGGGDPLFALFCFIQRFEHLRVDYLEPSAELLGDSMTV